MFNSDSAVHIEACALKCPCQFAIELLVRNTTGCKAPRSTAE